MPLNEASCAVVVICDRMPLNWVTRLLRTVCADASTTGAVAVVNVTALVSVPPIAPPDSSRPEGRRSVVVGGGDRQLAGGVHRRRQVVGQQRGIELVEGLDRAVGAVAEGDVDRRTAVEGGEGQGLAGEAAGRRGATRGEAGAGSGVAGEAERRERVAGAGDRQIGGRAGARCCSAPLTIDGCDLAGATASVAAPLAFVAVWTPVARSIAFSVSAIVAALQVDRRVAVAVGDDVAADAGAGGHVRSQRRRGVLERDGLAVDVQRRAVLDQGAERGSA